MKILLVDDDQDIATVFTTALTSAGFTVDVAPDGKTALEKAKTKPDFILLDQILPDIGGNEILKQLKNDESTKSIPVAMLSNFGQNELVDEAMKLGALEYILKYQIEPADLVAKIKALTAGKTEQNNDRNDDPLTTS